MEVAIDAFILKYTCDKCKEGGMERYTEPHQADKYQEDIRLLKHKCSNCGWVTFLNKTYPFLYVPEWMS